MCPVLYLLFTGIPPLTLIYLVCKSKDCLHTAPSMFEKTGVLPFDMDFFCAYQGKQSEVGY